jgi:hypothetical protein
LNTHILPYSCLDCLHELYYTHYSIHPVTVFNYVYEDTNAEEYISAL